MTLKDLQNKVDEWINTFGVRYFSELTNMVVLTEETGELARLMARHYGDQSFKNPEDNINIKEKIADELADILFVVTCLANQMNIDLEKAVNKNIDKKTIRDSIRHKNNTKL